MLLQLHRTKVLHNNQRLYMSTEGRSDDVLVVDVGHAVVGPVLAAVEAAHRLLRDGRRLVLVAAAPEVAVP